MIDPYKVISPRNRLTLHRVLYNGGADGWSAAEVHWKNDEGKEHPALALRWNGSKSGTRGFPKVGYWPTWFIVPEELADVIRKKVYRIDPQGKLGGPEWADTKS